MLNKSLTHTSITLQIQIYSCIMIIVNTQRAVLHTTQTRHSSGMLLLKDCVHPPRKMLVVFQLALNMFGSEVHKCAHDLAHRGNYGILL